MAEKQITTNQLARMIKEGFDGVDKKFEQVSTKAQFESLEKRLTVVEGDVKYIKDNLKSAVELEKEVDYIKNTLGIPALKK